MASDFRGGISNGHSVGVALVGVPVVVVVVGGRRLPHWLRGSKAL